MRVRGHHCREGAAGASVTVTQAPFEDISAASRSSNSSCVNLMFMHKAGGEILQAAEGTKLRQQLETSHFTLAPNFSLSLDLYCEMVDLGLLA